MTHPSSSAPRRPGPLLATLLVAGQLWAGLGLAGPARAASDPAERRFDVPWLVLDSSLACEAWGFAPATPLPEILEEIARHAEADPAWLDVSGGA